MVVTDSWAEFRRIQLRKSFTALPNWANSKSRGGQFSKKCLCTAKRSSTLKKSPDVWIVSAFVRVIVDDADGDLGESAISQVLHARESL